jgi:hypothetical protein
MVINPPAIDQRNIYGIGCGNTDGLVSTEKGVHGKRPRRWVEKGKMGKVGEVEEQGSGWFT